MIEFRNVVKTYRRRVGRLRRRVEVVEALRNCSFHIPRGALAGFLGPNGSGKTTSLKLMVGLLHRDSGLVSVNGFDPEAEPRLVREATGFLPEKPVYPPNVTVEQYLRHIARLRSIPWSDVLRVAKLVGIDEYMGKPIRSLSRGYLQRLGLAQALIGQPEILLLDEPTANLDPNARIEILNLIAVLKRDLQATIIISSHILPELQQVVDYVVLISNGVIVDYGWLGDIAAKYLVTTVYRVELAAGNARRLAKQLLDLPGVKGVMLGETHLDVHVDQRSTADFTAWLREAMSRGLVRGYTVRTSYLDELYRKAVGA